MGSSSHALGQSSGHERPPQTPHCPGPSKDSDGCFPIHENFGSQIAPRQYTQQLQGNHRFQLRQHQSNMQSPSASAREEKGNRKSFSIEMHRPENDRGSARSIDSTQTGSPVKSSSVRKVSKLPPGAVESDRRKPLPAPAERVSHPSGEGGQVNTTNTSSNAGDFKNFGRTGGNRPSGRHTATPEVIRSKLEKVLKDKSQFLRSARASFQQFDSDKSGTLDIREITLLIERLCQNLQLPPVDSGTLQQIFAKYDTDDSGALDLDEFAQFYWRLLLRVREKYYPSKKFRVRRDVFVGRIPLAQAGGISKIFDFKRKIGAGSFGEVHLVTELRSALTRVCKTINKDQAAVPLEQIEAEINVLRTLDHPNIIKIFDVYEDYNSVYIIMEHCEGGELLDRIIQAQQRSKTLTERYVMTLMQQILMALAYFHSQKILHKDLKPENVLFQDESPSSPIKVIDFGLAEIFKKTNEYSHNAAGTVLYMAPEVFQRRLHLKCDVWSAGCIMYLLLSGHLPFSGRSVNEIKQKVMREEPNYELHCRHVSDLALNLLKSMLTKQARQRCSAAEALQHPWFEQKNLRTRDVALPANICDNLKSYMKQAGLKNVLINLMAHQLDFSGSQVRQISQIFKALDKDQNGSLSANELAEGLRNAGVQPWEVTKIIQALDIDESGTISYTEFLAAAYTWRETELNIVWTAFNKLDTDHDGKISVDEFSRLLMGAEDEHANDLGQSRLLRRRGENNREQIMEEIHQLVAEIDKNGDGEIDWDEFLDYMRGPSNFSSNSITNATASA